MHEAANSKRQPKRKGGRIYLPELLKSMKVSKANVGSKWLFLMLQSFKIFFYLKTRLKSFCCEKKTLIAFERETLNEKKKRKKKNFCFP